MGKSFSMFCRSTIGASAIRHADLTGQVPPPPPIAAALSRTSLRLHDPSSGLRAIRAIQDHLTVHYGSQAWLSRLVPAKISDQSTTVPRQSGNAVQVLPPRLLVLPVGLSVERWWQRSAFNYPKLAEKVYLRIGKKYPPHLVYPID